MKSLPILATLCCIGTAAAQEIGRLHLRDNGDQPGGPTVVIDLTDPDIPPPPPLVEILNPAGHSNAKTKPGDDKESPTDAESADKQPKGKKGDEQEMDTPASSAPAPPADPEPGLAVRVSGFTDGTSKVDPESISLKAPFPAKPLGAVPSGWRLVRADDRVPIFDTEVKISSGPGLQLKVRPHVLVPDANGATVFAVGEPGFDPARGYRQDSTIGAILGDSIRTLKDEEKRMDGAIDRLEQLLISLPESTPASPAPPNPKPNRKP